MHVVQIAITSTDIGVYSPVVDAVMSDVMIGYVTGCTCKFYISYASFPLYSIDNLMTFGLNSSTLQSIP